MKQLMDLAEQLDKYVSNFPYQVNVLSETHTFNYMHTGILARFLQYPPILESFLSSLPDWDMEIGEPEISLPHNNLHCQIGIWKLVSQKSLYLTTTMTFWY